MQLSENFKFEEFYHSDIANKKGIKNIPNQEQFVNIVRLHDNCMAVIRKSLGHKVFISSGFRCKELNSCKEINGAKNSQHLTGKACDFTVEGQSNMSIFNWCNAHLNFDQLILERVNGKEWVHISFDYGKNRKDALIYDGKQYKKV